MNQSVLKALKLLDLFIDRAEWTLAEIADYTALPKPTAFRLLASLEASGFLIKVRNSDQDIRYRLGLKLLELGNAVSEQLELRKIALPHMKRLCREIDEVVHLVILDGQEAVYIEKVESKQALRMYTKVGKRSPVYIGSGPKLLFAFLTKEEQQNILANLQFAKFTENTISNKDEFLEHIKIIQENGYAVSEGEQDIGTIGFSYPIRNYDGKVIAALGISCPVLRCSGDQKRLLMERTAYYASQISRDLGYEP